MVLHRFRLDDLPGTPWRNGGGTTREVVSLPVGAGFDSLDWRVSVATIAADGPFSSFPGIDRTIMLLDGDGVRLRSVAPNNTIDHVLAEPLVPFGFSGEVALDCTLLGGESTDVNLMTRRGRGAGVVAVHRADVRVTGEAGLLLAVGGAVDVTHHGASERMPGSSGLWWDASGTFDVGDFGPGAALVAVTWAAAP